MSNAISQTGDLAKEAYKPVSLSTWGDLTKPPAQEKNSRTGMVETWREVVETIVFVVVLVLILQSFVAACFVIPTGSMAESLFGYHKKIECPACGTQFAINCSQEVEHPESGYRVDHGVCPNCLEETSLDGPGRRKGEPGKSLPDPGPTTGDRVIVSKFFNDFLGIPYARFDVVVFKYPGNSHPLDAGYGNPPFPISGPQKDHTAMNYIKRLVGLPGESIAIHGGDLYKMDGWQVPAVDHPRKIDLWKFENMYENAAQEDFRQGKFQILRKSPKVVLAESRPVYDHDHPPADLPNLPRWINPEGGFLPDGKTAFVVNSSEPGKTQWIRYQHLLRGNTDPSTGQPRKQLITDTMAYNDISRHRAMGVGNNWVADLILEAMVETSPATNQGALLFELSRGPERFEARIDIGGKSAEIFRKTGLEKVSLAKANLSWPSSGSVLVRMGNVDQTIHLWINGNLVFGTGIGFDAPKDFAPNLENDLEPASIGFDGIQGKVSAIKLRRDTYYTVRVSMPQDPDVSVRDWTAGPELAKGAYPKEWEALRQLPVKTYFVQPEHYLCMGDNSSHSSDGRSWGLVPHRLMLGQAVGVYWPWGRMGRIR